MQCCVNSARNYLGCLFEERLPSDAPLLDMDGMKPSDSDENVYGRNRLIFADTCVGGKFHSSSDASAHRTDPPERVTKYPDSRMRSAFTFLIIGSTAAALAWAQLPQAAWEGEVDGKVEITIRGDRMDTREISGPMTNALKYRVYDPLPARSGQVRLQAQQGRGSIRIAQQPGVSNDYTAVITVEDPQGGRSFYAFQLFWDAAAGYSSTPPNTSRNDSGNNNGRRYTIVDDRDPRNTQSVNNGNNRPVYPGGGSVAAPSSQIGGRNGSGSNFGEQYLRWTGTVDDEVIIECRQRDCVPLIQRGANVVRDRVEYTRPLPVRDVRVDLTDIQGRGEVRLVESASSRNNFTTRVKVRDTQGGAGDYAFVLRWVPPAEEERRSTEFGMRWTGRVDGKVRVIIEGSRTFVETLAGAPVSDERSTFDRTLPNYEGLNPVVTKRRGRGRVELVEYPSRRNNYRIVFTVEDDKGGSDAYEVEVGW